MVKKSVVSYVKTQLQRGYNIYAIRKVMLNYGYTDKDIDEAFNEVYHPTIRHELHLSRTTIFVIVFVCISFIGTALFIYYPQKGTKQLLDLNLEPVKTTAAPGESINFVKELLNLGSSKRYDVVIKQEILDPQNFNVITEKIETRAIETFGSTPTAIVIPLETKPGDYTLRVIVEYEDKKAVATLPVKIIALSGNVESCIDGIKNQNEYGVDCGGLCKPCENESKECNDNNPCTADLIVNGKCTNSPNIPCCGNGICEDKEQEICLSDCKKTEADGIASSETIEDIRELAKTNPSKALQQCNLIEIPDLKDSCISKIAEVQRSKNYCIQIKDSRTKDLCYSNIAKILNDNSICDDISSDGIKDACYMTFVLDNKDYSVCSKLTNKQLAQSCEYLRQVKEINDQQNKIQE